MINLQILANSTDITTKVQAGSLQITDSLNQRRDTCSFVVRGNGYIPQLNDEIEVYTTPTKIFGGVVVSIDQTVVVSDLVQYQVTCTDYAQYLDRLLVLERFENESINDIIASIITTYAAGFTYASVNAPQVVASVAFNRINVTECLQKLADLVGYSWYVDYDKDIHFFPKNENPAPFNLTDTSGNYVWDSLNIKRDIAQLRNAVVVEGGEAVGNERTEVFTSPTSSDERNIYRLANKFSEKPDVIVTTSGTPVTQTVGIDYLDDETMFDCLWNFNEKYIRFTPGNIPASGATVEVSGLPLFPVIIRAQSSLSIGEYGTYEFLIRDKSIRSRDEGLSRGLAELQAYQNGIIEGGFKTYDAGLKSGQIININSPIRATNENFLIQSVSFRMRTPYDGEWNIRLATLRTIGIIDFLRNLLKSNELKENEAEALLSFLQLSDEATAGDTLTIPTATTSAPYMWMPTDPGDDAATIAANPTKTPILWNKWTWTA